MQQIDSRNESFDISFAHLLMCHLLKLGDSFEITIEDNCQRWAGGFKTYFVHSMFTLPHLTLQSTIIPKEGGVISFSDDEKISLR